ncbi:MAG: leucine-rich repeat domain-containing protein [Firmicutes bacterium]|nr:leucine-rich repeat domain-containing protein [Bacillota bacterium]
MQKTNFFAKRKSTALLVIALMLLTTLVVGFTYRSNVTANAQANQATHEQFTFVTLAGTTNVSVRLADRTISRAVIPQYVYINNVRHTVTEIASTGFASVPSLREVRLPSTITRIGNNAFQNSANLESITLPAVREIGANAFSMNPRLSYIVIPKTVQTVGATILRNNTTKVYVRSASIPSGWVASWNIGVGTGRLAYTLNSQFMHSLDIEIVEKPATFGARSASIIGGIVQFGQPFSDPFYRDHNIVIPATYGGYNIIGIEAMAFSESQFATLTIEADLDSNNPIPLAIGSEAFGFVYGNNIEIKRNVEWAGCIELGWDTPNTHHFMGANVQTIVLPQSITKLPEAIFFDSSVEYLQFINLTTMQIANTTDEVGNFMVVLPSSLTIIEENAFGQVLNISHLVIPNSVQTAGASIVAGWTATQNVHLFFAYGERPAGWLQAWASGSNAIKHFYVPTITFVSVTFTTAQAGVLNPSASTTIEVEAGTRLNEIANVPVPTSASHNFTGYWFINSTRTTQFLPNTQITSELTLFAGWQIMLFDVVFTTAQSGVINPIQITSVSVPHGTRLNAINIPTPTSDSHTFTGRWYTNAARTTPFLPTQQITTDTTLFAGWTVKYFNITFITEKIDVVNHSDIDCINVAHGTLLSSISVLPPTSDSHIFTGRWYIDVARSVRFLPSQQITETLTLYAGWQIRVFTVTFVTIQAGVIGPSSISPFTNVGFGTMLSSLNIPTPTSTSHIFSGRWYTNSNRTTQFLPSSQIVGTITLYAGWQIRVFTVSFITTQVGVTNPTQIFPINVGFGSTLASINPTRPTSSNQIFIGRWYTNSARTIQFLPTQQITSNIRLYAGWGRAITLVFECRHNIFSSIQIAQGYDGSLIMPYSIKFGHWFMGWQVRNTNIEFADHRGRIQPVTWSIVERQGLLSNGMLFLTSMHNPREFTVSLFVGYGRFPTIMPGERVMMIVTFGSPAPNFFGWDHRPVEIPIRQGYVFAGFWTELSGGTMKLDSTMRSPTVWYYDHVVRLFARWIRV